MEKRRAPRRPRGKAGLIEGKCIACGGRCETACPTDAITLSAEGEPIIDAEACIGCGKCVKVCPAGAIEMRFTPEEQAILDQIAAEVAAGAESQPAEEPEDPEDPEAAALAAYLAQYTGVWVFVEQADCVAASVSWELLGVGKSLATSLGEELSALVLGQNVEHLCKEAFAYGATKAYLVDDPVLEDYRTAPYLEAFCQLAEKYKPEIILTGATGLGRDLAGAVAARLRTGLTADCTGLDIDDKRQLLQTRPAFGGNIMATIFTEKHRPQMASVRPHVMPMPCREDGATGEIVRETVELSEERIRTRVLEVVRDTAGAIDIGAAEYIVSGGRGMMSKENFALLEELAAELGGVVAGSRCAVDAGWITVDRQVGQTGKTVRPKVYIACGISGAIQHVVGMQDAETIIAINRDPEAPIFDTVTYGIVGDVVQVVPALIEEIRRVKAAKGAPDVCAL